MAYLRAFNILEVEISPAMGGQMPNQVPRGSNISCNTWIEGDPRGTGMGSPTFIFRYSLERVIIQKNGPRLECPVVNLLYMYLIPLFWRLSDYSRGMETV